MIDASQPHAILALTKSITQTRSVYTAKLTGENLSDRSNEKSVLVYGDIYFSTKRSDGINHRRRRIPMRGVTTIRQFQQLNA